MPAIDAADRKPRHAQPVARRANERESAEHGLRLRRCSKHGPDAEIVRLALELVHGARGKAHEAIGADRTPRVRQGHVLLADVHAVGVCALDEIGPVVQHEQRAVPVAGAPERLGCPDELVVQELLIAKLHDVDAPAHRPVEQGRRIVAVRPGLEDEIEA